MEGLRLPSSPLASIDLKDMLAIARTYFLDLHTPIRPSLAHYNEQKLLISEVEAAYAHLPAPENIPTASGNHHLLGFTRVSRVSTSRVHLDPLETLETLVNPSKP